TFIVERSDNVIIVHFFPTRRSSELVLQLEQAVVEPRQPRRADRADEFVAKPQRREAGNGCLQRGAEQAARRDDARRRDPGKVPRSEEHTSELQSRENLVCRLLLENK